MTLSIALEIIATLLTLVVCWILIAPIYLLVDSERGEYKVYQEGVFKIQLYPGRVPLLDINIAGFRLPQSKPSPKPKVVVKKKERKSGRSLNAWLYIIKNSLRSITVERFVIDLDTDDYPLNAKLFPAFQFANDGVRSCSINFSGRNYIGVRMKGRLINLVWIFLIFITKK